MPCCAQIVSNKFSDLEVDGASSLPGDAVDPSVFTAEVRMRAPLTYIYVHMYMCMDIACPLAQDIRLLDRSNIAFTQKRLDKFMEHHSEDVEACQNGQTIDLFVWHRGILHSLGGTAPSQLRLVLVADEAINTKLRFSQTCNLQPGQKGLTRVIVQNAEHQMVHYPLR